MFYGIEPEPLERQMEAEPEFCRDILETRIKGVFRDVLKISRDIPFTHVYRFTVGNADKEEVLLISLKELLKIQLQSKFVFTYHSKKQVLLLISR